MKFRKTKTETDNIFDKNKKIGNRKGTRLEEFSVTAFFTTFTSIQDYLKMKSKDRKSERSFK